jgi:steroid delta-isomerase-like uncharacterized protein
MSANRTRGVWYLALGLAAFVAAACQPAAPPAPDHAAAQQPVLDAFLGGWNTGNLDGLDAVLAANIRRRSSGGTMDANSLEEQKAVMTQLRTTYPDATVVADETIHLENATIVRWTFTGTNTGPGEIPPTGMSVTVSGMSLLRFADGKISEELVYFDSADWLTQLGYTMVPPAAE